jgi:hypothetical protein
MGLSSSLRRGVDNGGLLVTKAKPSLASGDKTGFIRAFTDEWFDLTEVYGVDLMMELDPGLRKGTVNLQLTATKPAGIAQEQMQVRYTAEYPNASVESFEACLFRCMVRLEKMLRDRVAHPSGKG